VCFENNWYSVPTRHAHRNASIEVYENRLRIIVDDAVVAEHQRSFGVGQRMLDPRHYVELLQRKHRAAASALALSDGRIPDELRALYERYRQADAASASKQWVSVLALLAYAPSDELARAVTRATARGTDDPAAIALLLRQGDDPPKTRLLDSHRLPQAARILAPVVDLSAYATAKLMEVVA
jgi:hypothetical protein